MKKSICVFGRRGREKKSICVSGANHNSGRRGLERSRSVFLADEDARREGQPSANGMNNKEEDDLCFLGQKHFDGNFVKSGRQRREEFSPG